MTEHKYMAGASSPVSGVSHLFERDEVQTKNYPVDSLCGAVASYGSFQGVGEVPEDEVCQNCQRIRERHQQDDGGEADA